MPHFVAAKGHWENSCFSPPILSPLEMKGASVSFSFLVIYDSAALVALEQMRCGRGCEVEKWARNTLCL